VVIDPTGKRNGRGAYLCDQLECRERAFGQARLLNQALNTELSEAELAALAEAFSAALAARKPANHLATQAKS
jgi:predicted RNA-binding protein YlxR (DUF448 family)